MAFPGELAALKPHIMAQMAQRNAARSAAQQTYASLPAGVEAARFAGEGMGPQLGPPPKPQTLKLSPRSQAEVEAYLASSMVPAPVVSGLMELLGKLGGR